jgi:hypothetical protein
MLKSKGKYKYHTRALFFGLSAVVSSPLPFPSQGAVILYIASLPLPSLRAAEQPLARTASTVRRHSRRYGPPITVQNIAPRIPLL